MLKKWVVKKQNKEQQEALAKALAISEITAGILISRGIDTQEAVHEFLKPSLLNLKDPFLMKGMHKAVTRIKEAIQNEELIMVHGDYDVDGICATALIEIILKKMGAKIIHYIPNRIEDGYGVGEKAITIAKQKKVNLLITVDCGITARDEIDALNSLGIDVIITDHHQPSGNLPNAYCILNPLQKNCDYPDKDLAGVGVAFKLVSALYGTDSDYIYGHLDLVCLGTISDVAPLIGENRILVKNGLSQLKDSKKIGLQSLLTVVKLNNKDITSQNVGYILGPRINAAGRVGSAELALTLFLTTDEKEAQILAETLDTENKNRQKLERKTLTQALSKIEKYFDFQKNTVVVLQDETWHSGVIGIVASRIVDKFYRPALIMTKKGSLLKGSGRSIKNFHLVNVLEKCSHLLENYGGHRYAAGLSLQEKNMDDFKKLINKIASDSLKPEDLMPSISIDMEIELGLLTDKFFAEMDMLAPFGMGNPRPTFATKNLKIKTEPQILGSGTIKTWVTDNKMVCEAIGFGMAETIPSNISESDLELAYSCQLKTYKGVESIQLQLKDLKVKQPVLVA